MLKMIISNNEIYRTFYLSDISQYYFSNPNISRMMNFEVCTLCHLHVVFIITFHMTLYCDYELDAWLDIA